MYSSLFSPPRRDREEQDISQQRPNWLRFVQLYSVPCGKRRKRRRETTNWGITQGGCALLLVSHLDAGDENLLALALLFESRGGVVDRRLFRPKAARDAQHHTHKCHHQHAVSTALIDYKAGRRATGLSYRRRNYQCRDVVNSRAFCRSSKSGANTGNPSTSIIYRSSL